MIAFVRTLFVLLSMAGSPAWTAPVQPPTTASAAFKAVAFGTMPRPSYVEVSLRDDAPENVELAWTFHHALERRGFLADSGPTLRLTLETHAAAMVGDRGRSEQWSEAERPKFMGVMRAVLTDMRNGARLWEGEAVFETIWGDITGGAIKLVPTFVDALGRTVERQAITLR